jgi:zinc/manganese transport system permease protein
LDAEEGNPAVRTAVGGILLSLAPGVPVSVFVATISFLIYLICWLIGHRRHPPARV